jgi:hypothetical protein
MPALLYTYSPLPAVWPGKRRASDFVRKRSPFKVIWTKTEALLARELAHLKAKDVKIAIDIRNPGYFRQDGMIRADARPVTPAVILSFTNGAGVRLQFPCDTYAYWQDNVHAIALSLEALRAVDRHQVTQGDAQYIGFKALPPGASSAGAAPEMSEDRAATILADYCDFPAHLIVQEASVARIAIRTAKSRTHPDAKGSPGAFEDVTAAAAVIARLHGQEG